MTYKQKAYIGLAATSVLWGTSWVASRIAVQSGVPGLQVAAIRQFLGGILFVGFFLLKGEKLPTPKQLLWLAGMAVLLFVVANGFSTVALKFIPSGLGALIAALYPLSVVLIEKIVFRNNRITLITFLGMLLGLGGIAVVFYENAFQEQPEGYGYGIVLSILAMLGWSIGTIIIARNKVKINPYNATGWQMLISSFIMAILAMAEGKTVPLADIPSQTWLSITYLVSASSIVAFAAFIYTMKHLEPAIAALYAYINPIVAMLVGTMLLNEQLTFHIILGSIITLIGVFMVNMSLKKQREKALKEMGEEVAS